MPVDISLGTDFDTIVITGPNTGGKTVSIKTIGLMSLMAMCGLMLPVDDRSRISVFDHVLADIGKHMVKDRYSASVVNREHESAHRHQRHKTDRLYRNGFTARVRTGYNYRIKVRAETDINRHNFIFVNQRMSCTS